MINIFLIIFCKLLGMYLCIGYSYLKITNNKTKKLIIYALSVGTVIAFFNSLSQIYFESFVVLTLFVLIYSILLSIPTKIYLIRSVYITILSLALSYFAFGISSTLTMLFWILFFPYQYNFILLSIISIIQFTLIYLIFKIKRFKHGLPFLTNKNYTDIFEIFTLTISILIIFLYFILNYYNKNSIQYAFFGLLIIALLLFPIVQRTLLLYQKYKLFIQTLKDYEQELSATQQKLETALAEKEKIVKSNHEFYHRQEALNKKLDNLINLQSNSMNAEFSNEYSDILDRLNTLSSEYKTQTTVLPIHDKTNIIEIDDMLIYMQSECAKNNIEFILKINCDINHIINNFITKSQLETLLGDLIRNAIIAINHSSSSFKSVMVIFGIKEESYELCIYDSGIPFEIETLINLGLHPASTHLDDGGTGIGFITTFETINSCKASFIINEITNNNYTKSLEIKFDNKNEYVIFSNRLEEIRKANILNRDIVLK